MATKAIFHLLSLRKEGHIISFSFPYLFPCVTRSYSTEFHGMFNPRSLVISNSEINLPEYRFSLLTISYLNTQMKGSSRSAEILRSPCLVLELGMLCHMIHRSDGARFVLFETCACLKPSFLLMLSINRFLYKPESRNIFRAEKNLHKPPNLPT